MVDISEIRKARSPTNEPVFRPPVVFDVGIKALCVDSANKPGLCVEIWFDYVVLNTLI